jgi:hypothetical protein
MGLYSLEGTIRTSLPVWTRVDGASGQLRNAQSSPDLYLSAAFTAEYVCFHGTAQFLPELGAFYGRSHA